MVSVGRNWCSADFTTTRRIRLFVCAPAFDLFLLDRKGHTLMAGQGMGVDQRQVAFGSGPAHGRGACSSGIDTAGFSEIVNRNCGRGTPCPLRTTGAGRV